MTKSMTLVMCICFFLILIIDQVTKHYCADLIEGTSFGPFYFLINQNRGIILGSFSDLPPALRIVSISSLYGFLFLIFILIQYVLAAKLTTLRTGAVIFLGGITGNTIDRAVQGSVIDFISFVPNIYFNVADVFQVIGFALIVFSLFRNHEEIWHPNCLRKNYIVNPQLQFRFAIKFAFIGLALSLTIGVFTVSFLTLLSIEGPHLQAFTISYLAITLIYIIVTFAAGFVISHRYLGPLYAFEIFIEDIIQDKDRDFRLRKGDGYKHLEEMAEKIRNKVFQR